ncbi:MAG TPA: hypothetical protein PKN80_01915 [bacterium]|uniref:DNA polymerase III subunit delta n=1 Tax=candidate division TA06 bacterium ADurb.Bin417 TaxID=1852828 RepID=A0A1V5MJN9_UNCT6|nr:MAG: DNA polymerase III subunit delta [candidate division TA06 bacterium ADurb.Bin417]HNQ34801.1 hypothetical protein [bacterium]HNS48522.1 hypothetical protein [bacterium]
MTLQPFYLLLFQDLAAAERKAAELKKAAFPDGITAFNETVLYGEDTTAGRIMELCQTPPFAGGRHFILLRRAEKLGKEDRDALFEYLKKPSASAFLVMLFETSPKNKFPFPGNQFRFFFKGEAADAVDPFGVTRVLQRGNLKRALQILDRQYTDDRKHFPQFMGILTWYLRSRVEGQGRLNNQSATLFKRFCELDRDVRTGRRSGREAVELAILHLARRL